MTIAYFGASVTAQREGYRPRAHALLAGDDPAAERAVHAGVGGVGVVSGLFLLDDLVLRHRPSLCFVEFATTDMAALTPDDLLRPALEAVVERLRAADCEPCFLLLGRRGVPAANRRRVRAAYEEVARHHGVRCVDVAAELEEATGMLADGVHTTQGGAECIARRIADDVARHGRPRPQRARGASCTPSMLATAVTPARPDELADPADAVTGTLRFSYPYVAVRPGNAFTHRLRGELVGLLVAIGPTTGGVVVSTGDGWEEERVLWDRWCTYERLSTVILERRVPAASIVRVEARRIDRSTGSDSAAAGAVPELRLIAYLERLG